MGNPKVITWEPYLALQERVEEGRDFFKKVLEERDFLQNLPGSEEQKIIKIAFGEKTRFGMSALLGIRIIPVNWKPSWLATLARTDRYNAYVDCMIKSGKAEIQDEMITTFAGAVAQHLLDFNKLSVAIPEIKTRAYQSWVDNITFGYSLGQIYRVARIDFWEDIQHVYTDVSFRANVCT